MSWVTPWPGASVFPKARTVSTMDDAWVLALSGCPTGTVAVADYQERGRGRVPGRTWLSSPKESLLATVVLRIPDMRFPIAELPLRAGVATALGIEEATGAAVEIKWPNDVMSKGRKLAGLLCEVRGGTALVGIGVNCSQKVFPPEIAGTARSLFQVCGRTIPPPALLSAILTRLKGTASGGSWHDQMRRRLSGRGKIIRVELLGSGRIVEGELRDIDDQGRLLIQTGDGRLETLSQGELIPTP